MPRYRDTSGWLGCCPAADVPTCQHCGADLYREGDAPELCDDCEALPKCSECDAPTATGDDEPCSGLCHDCDEREAQDRGEMSAAEERAAAIADRKYDEWKDRQAEGEDR